MVERIDAATTRRWIEEAARVLAEQRGYLTDLDAAIGDADHGVNMDRGFRAAVEREAAEAGVQATIPLQARKGRASYLGERSIGHQDPGATSAAYILRALESVVG